MNTDYKKLAELYQYEAEAFELFYRDRLSFSNAFICFGGVIMQMISDINAYELKNGKSDKLEMQKERVKILQGLFTDFGNLDADISRLKEMFRKCNNEKLRLSEENEQLKKQLESTINAWEQMG